jgi:hypothetical protein
MIKWLYKKAAEKIASGRQEKEAAARLAEAAVTLVGIRKQLYEQLPPLLEQKPLRELEPYNQRPELMFDKLPNLPTYTYWSFTNILHDKLCEKGWPLISLNYAEFAKKAPPTQKEVQLGNGLAGLMNMLLIRAEESKSSAAMYLEGKDEARTFVKRHAGDVEAVAAELRSFNPSRDLKPYHKDISIGRPLPV